MNLSIIANLKCPAQTSMPIRQEWQRYCAPRNITAWKGAAWIKLMGYAVYSCDNLECASRACAFLRASHACPFLAGKAVIQSHWRQRGCRQTRRKHGLRTPNRVSIALFNRLCLVGLDYKNEVHSPKTFFPAGKFRQAGLTWQVVILNSCLLLA